MTTQEMMIKVLIERAGTSAEAADEMEVVVEVDDEAPALPEETETEVAEAGVGAQASAEIAAQEQRAP